MPEMIEISVGDLAEFCFPEGSLGTLPSVERMLQGSSAHKRLQNVYAADESIRYRREQSLSRDTAYPLYTLRVQGRADGIFYDGTDWFIHEIKSTYTALPSIERPLKTSHKAQMMLYAFIFAENEGLSTVRTRLTYSCLPDGKTVDFDYSFTFDALRDFFVRCCDAYARLLDRRVEASLLLTESAAKAVFPFPAFRTGQREGAAQVFAAIRHGRFLFLQAPTGSGKTMMALFPAIKALADEPCRIFCLSAKTRTRTVTHQALQLLRAGGVKIKSCEISARQRVCRMEKQDCSPEYCPYSRDFFRKVYSSLAEMLSEDDFTPERILALSDRYEVCPYELSLILSEECHVIMADYNYLFDPNVYLRRFFDNEGRYLFLIDEAHNLVSRGRDMYSCTLNIDEMSRAKHLLPKEHRVAKRLAALRREVNKALKSETDVYSNDEIEKISASLLSLGEAALSYDNLPGEVSLYLKELFRCHTLLSKYREDCFRLFRESTKKLSLVCLDASPFLEDSLKKGSAAVLYSATLSPYSFYKNCILPETEAFGYQTDYPFDPSHLLVIADYSVDTRYSSRDRYYAIIAEKIRRGHGAHHGNTLVFFPSYAFLHSVAEYCSEAVLQPSEAEEIPVFLELFSQTSHTLGFAVSGSHLSEGIDFPFLSGIVIVGVSFPQFNDSRQLIRAHFDEKYGSGFEFAYVYPGISKVCQAAGRLIRGAEDRGFLVLMDERFRQYRFLLPPYWVIREVKTNADYDVIASMEHAVDHGSAEADVAVIEDDGLTR